MDHQASRVTAKQAEENRLYIDKIIKATGWERKYAEEQFAQARKRTGCALKEYCIYKFYEMTEEEQDQVFLINLSRKLSNKYNVNKKLIALLCDKEQTNELFGTYLKRPWCVNKKVSFKEFQEIFSGSTRIIYKPLAGNRGKGVEAFHLDAESMRTVYKTISEYPVGVVEEYVVQHPAMSMLAKASVNTIRVVTISSNTQPVTADGKMVDVAYASVRIGGGKSVVDNFHSGGMVANIDLETGKIVTDAADMEGNVFAKHPVTGTVFKDFQIPFFREVLELVTEAIEKNRIEGYLGWDIAVREDGPVLVEVNAMPGVVLLSTPYVAERKGTKHVMDKYLTVAEGDKNMSTQIKKVPQTAQEKVVQEVMKKTGWTRAFTIEQLRDAEMRTGMTYAEYNKYDFHKIPVEKQGKEFRKLLEKRAEKNLKQEVENKMYLAKIVHETGWDYEHAMEKILDARARTHCLYKEYLRYSFWNLDEATQNEMFLYHLHMKIRAKYDVDKEFVAIAADKTKTNTHFAEYVRRPWCVNTEITEEEFAEKFSNSKRVIYKPFKGLQGKGIQAFTISPETAKNVYAELSELPKGVVEEYVVQHPRMSALNPSSVNTLRVVTISSNTVPVTSDGRHSDIAYVAIRIGGGDAIVDNYHGGGMTAAVDLETGRIVTNAINEQRQVFEKHIVTGTTFKGFEIPFFEDVKKFVLDACDKKRVGGYVGWDIAVTENGPVLIEINTDPGAMLLSSPWVTEKRGMKHVMEKYL